MPRILDGKKARDFFTAKLIERVKKLPEKPTLALIEIGNNKESGLYIAQKKKFAKLIGALVEHIHFEEGVNQSVIVDMIDELNQRLDIHGIIIQLPIPQTYDTKTLINRIDPKKDVDGLTDENQEALSSGKPLFVPATARGVSLLLDFYDIPVTNKKVVVFGRSRLVGSPVAKLLEYKGAHVSVCHSKTENPKNISKTADIIVVAIGKPEYIDASFIQKGVVVIDVGINDVSSTSPVSIHKLEEEIPKRKVVGDVNFASVSPLVSAISPVPGGVGPMTVLSLFDNLIVSAEHIAP